MNRKETVITIIAALFFTGLTFFAGTKYNTAVHGKLDYQITLKVSYDANVKDSITLYDGPRKLGTVALTYGEPFAELIMKDTE